MKYRVIERSWDIDRRRYAVEGLRWEIEGEQVFKPLRARSNGTAITAEAQP